MQDDLRPGVTIRPDAIPVDHTLVLAAERWSRPGRRPPIVLRTLLVSGPAPACVGEFLTPRSTVRGFGVAALEIVADARAQAFELQQLNVGPEHVLLALLRRRGDLAARALNSLGVRYEESRGQLAQRASTAPQFAQRSSPSQAPFTPPATRAFLRARAEAPEFGDGTVEPAHILLGLIDDLDSPAVRVLRGNHADPAQVRATVIELLNRSPPDDDALG